MLRAATSQPGRGRRQSCTTGDATARLHDAIGCPALREPAADATHSPGIEVLRTVDVQLAATLARLLSRQQQAAQESRDVSAREAAASLRQATSLVDPPVIEH